MNTYQNTLMHQARIGFYKKIRTTMFIIASIYALVAVILIATENASASLSFFSGAIPLFVCGIVFNHLADDFFLVFTKYNSLQDKLSLAASAKALKQTMTQLEHLQKRVEELEKMLSMTSSIDKISKD